MNPWQLNNAPAEKTFFITQDSKQNDLKYKSAD